MNERFQDLPVRKNSNFSPNQSVSLEPQNFSGGFHRWLEHEQACLPMTFYTSHSHPHSPMGQEALVTTPVPDDCSSVIEFTAIDDSNWDKDQSTRGSLRHFRGKQRYTTQIEPGEPSWETVYKHRNSLALDCKMQTINSNRFLQV